MVANPPVMTAWISDRVKYGNIGLIARGASACKTHAKTHSLQQTYIVLCIALCVVDGELKLCRQTVCFNAISQLDLLERRTVNVVKVPATLYVLAHQGIHT